MRVQYDDERAAKIQDQVLTLLKQHDIPPHPYAYSVVYDYFSYSNTTINQQIDQLLTLNKKLKADDLKIIYYENIEPDTSDNIDTTNALLKLLNGLLKSLDPESSNIKELVNVLSKASNNLESYACTTIESVNEIVDELVLVAGRALVNQNELSDRVKKTEHEIQSLKRSLEISKKAVETDPLTGLVNRFGFDNTLVNWGEEEFVKCGLLLCDIDYFKNINDSYGHLIGDKVLIRIGQEMKAQVKGKDVVCRWGGEEFAVLLKDVSTVSQLREIAESMRTAVSDIKLVHSKSKDTIPSITFSVGATLLRNHGDWDNMIKRADRALYNVKENGRNSVSVIS